MRFSLLLHSLLALAVISLSSCRKEDPSSTPEVEGPTTSQVDEKKEVTPPETVTPEPIQVQAEPEGEITVGGDSPDLTGGSQTLMPQAPNDGPITIGGGLQNQAGGSQTLLPQAQNSGPITIGAAQAEAMPQLTPEQQQQALDQIFQMRAKQQAEGLGTGKVRVNKAYQYRGYSDIAPNPNAAIEAHLVAVDVTISGHTPHFDIDDIEIVDDSTLVSYGSDPFIAALTLDGELMSIDEEISEAPAPSRWLLIYAFPKASPRFQLYYWGQALLPGGMSFESSGLSLPYPAVEE